jgi:hypothetical protein
MVLSAFDMIFEPSLEKPPVVIGLDIVEGERGVIFLVSLISLVFLCGQMRLL